MLQTLSSAAKLEPVKVEPAKEAEDDNIANLTQITPWNFDEIVGGDNNVLVMFQAPWCGACKKYYPKYVETAMMLNKIPGLTLARADVTEFEYETLQEDLQVPKVPTIKIFKKGSTKPIHLAPQEAWEMHFKVKEALGMPIPNKCMFGDSDAEDITEKNWHAKVMDTNTSVLVEFYAPWCKHCKAFTPVFNNIARKASKIPGIRVVRVNVDKQKALGEQYGVKRLPTLKIFSRKNKDGMDYELPDASEHLEMVGKILERLKAPDATEEQEAQAKALLATLRTTMEKDPAQAVDLLTASRATLNTTRFWHASIQPFEQTLFESHAASLKETAVGLATSGKCAEALPLLERILKDYPKTRTGASDAVENVAHNCRSQAAAA